MLRLSELTAAGSEIRDYFCPWAVAKYVHRLNHSLPSNLALHNDPV
ncbi:hypothetical protein Poly30_48610 [Planctomycetes bacterium Poly30]|uniref:Uncharacterized protein n=1 Tax=Saltatorellus ferox TaxID=2528018 RepID=A0A518EYZ1_9BACT|nr:hypothetical protein Poly30_48610 [Planctomycetes bacterium Poly30]